MLKRGAVGILRLISWFFATLNLVAVIVPDLCFIFPVSNTLGAMMITFNLAVVGVLVMVLSK